MSRATTRPCGVCQREPAVGLGAMCAPCSRSHDRTAHRDGSVMEAILWAADRARASLAKRTEAAEREAEGLRRLLRDLSAIERGDERLGFAVRQRLRLALAPHFETLAAMSGVRAPRATKDATLRGAERKAKRR